MLLFTYSSTTWFENTTSFATEQQFSWSDWQCTRKAVEARYKHQWTKKKRQENALNAATALWDRCVNAAKWRTTRSNDVDAQWERNREAVTSLSNSYSTAPCFLAFYIIYKGAAGSLWGRSSGVTWLNQEIPIYFCSIHSTDIWIYMYMC